MQSLQIALCRHSLPDDILIRKTAIFSHLCLWNCAHLPVEERSHRLSDEKKIIVFLIFQRTVMLLKFLVNKIPVFLINMSSDGRQLFFVFPEFEVRFFSIILFAKHIFDCLTMVINGNVSYL